MNNDDLDKLLKSAPVPERPTGYWEDFPQQVMTALPRGPRRATLLQMPAFRRLALSRVVFAMSVVVACFLIGFTMGSWQQQVTSKTADERVEKIKRALQGKKLPSVSVKLAERHYGAQTIDPAAETELGKVLQECGFKVVDDQSAETAEVEITGEAFSAFGMRKGNLISCKSRVELKAHKRGGELLIVDRQTSVAVDVAEQTAAKTALQNAALEVAVRILPKLAQ